MFKAGVPGILPNWLNCDGNAEVDPEKVGVLGGS